MSEPLVTVDTFKFLSDAAMAKVLLESDGIPAYLFNTNAVGTLPVDSIELQVRPDDEIRARATLTKLHAEQKTAQRDQPRSLPEKCLSCGRPMPSSTDTCPACGWTFRGEEQVWFANGPVPESLIAKAWMPMGSRRFAFRPDDVPRYLEWCTRETLEIHGWEMWGRSALGHVLLEIHEDGDAADLLAAAATVQPDRADGVYISMNVLPRAAAVGA
jgi:hypothetical protein